MLDYFQNGKIYGLDYVENSKIEDRKKLISSILAEFEVNHNAMVYYYNIVEINIENYDLEILNIFYVGQNEEDWVHERLSKDNEMYIETYALNDNPPTPELGFVKVGSVDGNLVRKS